MKRTQINSGRSKKGLYFSFDAIIASTIFILTMISVISYWHSVHTGIKQEDLMMMEEAMRISDLILLPNQGNGFGFANSFDNKTIILQKVSDYATLTAADSDKIKIDVGTPYNVYITFDIFDAEDTHLKGGIGSFEIGKSPGDAKTIGKFTRISSAYDEFEGEKIVKISVFLYTQPTK